MKFVDSIARAWREDHLLKRVIRNTSYLFSSSMASTALSSGQVLLATLLLGAGEYGVLHIILDFASNVNRLFSFRMGELVVKYAGQSLAIDRRDEAAAIIKSAALAEALSAVLAYILLYLSAPLASQFFLDDVTYAVWIRLYGIALLGNAVTEVAIAVLQIGNHYRSQAVLLLAQNIITFSGIGLAFVLKGNIMWILTAYLVGKLVYGGGLAFAALRRVKPMLGSDWIKAPMALLKNKAELARFAVSTNISATVNLLVRDSELLWIGFLLSPVQAGYYKLALSLMGLMLMPINPFIQTTFPEITRAVAVRDWSGLRNLLRRTSSIAAAWTGACLLGLLILGAPLLNWYKGGEYGPAYPLMLILILGYGTANILFWSRPLLLALGLPNVPLRINTLAGVLKTSLMLILVRPFGYLMQGALMSGYFVLSVGWIVIRGLREIRKREGQLPEGEPA